MKVLTCRSPPTSSGASWRVFSKSTPSVEADSHGVVVFRRHWSKE
ncbi:hypothetical protein [Brachybacterium sp. GPGPB12]